MKKTTKIFIGITSVALVGGGIATSIENSNKSKLKSLILSSIDGRVSATGTIKDFQDVFNGDSYIDSVMSKLSGKPFVKLKDEYVTKYRTELFNAIDGIGTNDESIKSVFSSLKDKIAIAQVAQSYKNHYKETLLDAILGDVSVGSALGIELNNAILLKPNYRILKS